VNDVVTALLLGQFTYPDNRTEPWQVTFINGTDVDLRMSFIGPQGWIAGLSPDGFRVGYAGALVPAHGEGVVGLVGSPTWMLFTEAHSGGFVGVLQVQNPMPVATITRDILQVPGDIGPIPEPGQWGRLIPVDSQRVVVGIGTTANGKHIVREQCWRRMPESYTLAPNETRTVSRTVTAGMERTSSETSTFEASLGLSASAGWGPVSASISASLSRSSTTTHSVAFSRHETSFTSETLTNTNPYAVMFLLWQFTDIVTVYNGQVPEASAVTVGQPMVMRGPYPLNVAGVLDGMASLSLPEPPDPTRAPQLVRGAS
jgi:hypothetical protein